MWQNKKEKKFSLIHQHNRLQSKVTYCFFWTRHGLHQTSELRPFCYNKDFRLTQEKTAGGGGSLGPRQGPQDPQCGVELRYISGHPLHWSQVWSFQRVQETWNTTTGGLTLTLKLRQELTCDLLRSEWDLCLDRLVEAEVVWVWLTLYDLVIGEVQVEQEEHVQQRQSPTEEETRSLTHRPGQQCRHLRGRHTGNHVSLRLSREPGADGKCSTHHAQSGQSSHQQPEDIEQEVEVDVVCDEEDGTVTEQTVTLMTADRKYNGKNTGPLVCTAQIR